MVEHVPDKNGVEGSIPSTPTIWASSSVAERYFCKVEVGGSIPPWSTPIAFSGKNTPLTNGVFLFHNSAMNKIRTFLSKIKKELPKILRGNLYGIYIYGSLTYGDFDSRKSDIDCIVVIKRELNKDEIRLLKNWYKNLSNNPLAKRLEMAYAIKKNLTNISRKAVVSKTPLFYKGRFYTGDSDAYKPIVWFNIREKGLTLFGPPPKSFVLKITKRVLINALWQEVEHMKRKGDKWLRPKWSRCYVVLTLCRVLYTLRTSSIVSKETAAKWCLKELPQEWHSLISWAVKEFRTKEGDFGFRTKDKTKRFMKFVLGSLSR